ncbi:MAG: hypothetical protein ACUVQS_05390 [Candidatus Bipolaricaulaceae bacterium]
MPSARRKRLWQEFTSLVHRAGCGSSHVIGTGSRDFSDAVGGLTALAALDVLEADSETEVIVLLGKPSGEGTLACLDDHLKKAKKPGLSCFPWGDP